MQLMKYFDDLWKNPWAKGIIQILFVIVYFAIGCGFYYANEGWSGYTTCFFTVVTICTVGKQYVLFFIPIVLM